LWLRYDNEEQSSATPFGLEPQEAKIMFMHTLVFNSEKDIPPNSGGISAGSLLDMFPKANWIFVGDNHHTFHYQKKGRHVLSPGCLNRQSSDLIDYQPVCYYIDTDEDIVEAIPIPDDSELVTDAYIQKENERESRITAFVEKIQNQCEVSLSFIDNLRETLKQEAIEPEVKKAVEKVCLAAGVEL
jgi:hypothetical protein